MSLTGKEHITIKLKMNTAKSYQPAISPTLDIDIFSLESNGVGSPLRY